MAKLENVIIIGAGPAGISAALYLARGNMNPLLIYDGTGALEKAEKIENYYGLSAPLSGSELFETGLSQVKALGVRTVEAQVLGLGGFDTFEIKTTEGTFESRSVILATGGKRKAPQIPGLKEFEGRGVSYCAVCDAFFYRGKDVAVLGNSDFALHEAEELSNTAGSVTIYTDGQEPNFSREPSMEVNTMKIQAIEGDGKVSGLRLGEELKATDIESGAFKGAEGVFVALGTAGSGELARQIGAELTEKRNIQVNSSMETTVPGLFAAGDCTGGLLQIAKAVYEGAQAGISAGKYVRSLK
ncbi:Thioredoxin reductase [uncultured Blautia sp.]